MMRETTFFVQQPVGEGRRGLVGKRQSQVRALSIAWLRLQRCEKSPDLPRGLKGPALQKTYVSARSAWAF